MSAHEGDGVSGWLMLTPYGGSLVIGFVLAVAAAQASPAAQSSFGFACKVEGTLGPDGKLDAFPQKRPLGFFVEKREPSAFAPSRTTDPTNLLGGKQVAVFHATPRGYMGVTGLTTQDIGLSFSRSDSTTANEWTVGILPVTHEQSPRLTVGKCLLMDGITGPEFDQISQKLSQMR